MANTPRFNLDIAMASAGTVTLPLPTAYGYSSDHIIVLDSLSAIYSASAATTASAGGTIRTTVGVNGTANIVFSQLAPIVSYTTGTAANGFINLGGVVWESVNGIPLHGVTAVNTESNLGIVGTAYTIKHAFTGTLATGGAIVNLFVSWHYEKQSERR